MDSILFYILRYGMFLLYALATFFILKFIFSSSLKKVHSNWNTLIDGFNYSCKQFYIRDAPYFISLKKEKVVPEQQTHY